MSLDALAPDQRAVVQLVLQQDRSYEQLAGLLGISVDAVRERAHKGLARIAPSDELGADELPLIADYLLGQQSDGERDGTRLVLAGSPAARSWARAVAAELAGVARTPLPDIPGDEAAPVAEPEVEAEPEAAAVAVPASGGAARPRSRPRPRRARDEAAPATAAEAAAAAASTPKPPRRGRADLRGGALLIGGIAILVVAGIILLVSGGSDSNGSKTKTSASTTASASPTATATAQFQPLGQLALKSPTGGKAKGQMVIFANSNGGIAFTIQGTGVPASGASEAYAVWLTGGDAPHRLGFAPQVKADGKLGTSGPRDQDATKFAKWFSQAKDVVVSKETSETAKSPGPVVLAGKIPTGSATATPTPTP